MGIEEGELFLFMPSEQLADETRRELRRARLERDNLLPGAPRSGSPGGEPAEIGAGGRGVGGTGGGVGAPARPAAPAGPLFPELPPIKLAGDDE
jgi:hypothetical protein